ncbi:PIN domain-containing protein [Pseudorhizobium endolithicum]|uniref:Ribonuclease VapC n=1 Tax=Pseudorhizobium endolithicum TaxID=1191678 RepID=A0ABM8PDD1_9HYPH|nr:type II toxin-antitoxin system VapC family toxin [Pseudorhizobium endolithicum]CAD7023637.1 PIN domain-containing protein [Pseudorhizobium endolithicum]
MSGFLLDTNVVSMSSPTRPVDEAFAEWLRQQEKADLLFVSVVTIHEITKGIVLLEQKGATSKAAHIREWLDVLVAQFDDRILPFDIAAAALAGEMEARALSAGHRSGMADAMIAATAKLHGLVVVTHNIRDFQILPVEIRGPENLRV